ncbi:MAG: hypothetical protein Q9195_008205 [Heterodermia aff. obscurata]
MSFVFFTNNQVDATRIAGDYLKWQFPGGPLVDDPAAQITSHLSLKVNKVYCWSSSEKDEYEYQGPEDQSYDNGEIVVWTGPNDDGIINMHGKSSKTNKSSNQVSIGQLSLRRTKMPKTVTFSNNKVDATKIQGGVIKWQFTGGQIYDPPNITTDAFSLQTDTLTCWVNNEAKKKYKFQGKEDQSFDSGDTVELSGPTDSLITLHGKAGAEVTNWKAGGGNGGEPGDGQPESETGGEGGEENENNNES